MQGECILVLSWETMTVVQCSWSCFGVEVCVLLADEEIDANWYPRQKVDYAKRKLMGDNSAHIMK